MPSDDTESDERGVDGEDSGFGAENGEDPDLEGGDDGTDGDTRGDEADDPLELSASDDGPEGSGPTAAGEVDQRIVDLLSWVLDTETRAKIYIHLLANPGSTSEEVAQGTGLYPSTVREALAELHEEERVTREKRVSEGAGNNPYEYTAIQPSELVGGVVDQVQRELNTIFTLDRVLDRDGEEAFDEDVEPVTIVVNDAETADLEGDDGGEDVDSTADESRDLDADPDSHLDSGPESESDSDSDADSTDN